MYHCITTFFLLRELVTRRFKGMRWHEDRAAVNQLGLDLKAERLSRKEKAHGNRFRHLTLMHSHSYIHFKLSATYPSVFSDLSYRYIYWYRNPYYFEI